MYYRSNCCSNHIKLNKPNNNPLLGRLTEKYIRELFDEHDVSEEQRIELIEYYYNQLSTAIDNNFSEDLDEDDKELAKSLKKNIAEFSAFKETDFKNTLHQILFKDNKLLTWSEFKKAAKEKGVEYNERYLKTEHDHTISSANIAKKWKEFEEDKDIYPNLEFHTVGDSQVRDSHEQYNGLIAAVDDPIWLKLTIPLDWGCRCYITQTTEPVNKESYNINFDSIKEVFKNNPAKSGEIFKDKEPYNQRLSDDEKKAATKLANKVLDKKHNKTYDKNVIAKLKEQRKTIKDFAKQNIVGKTIKYKDIEKPIQFTVTGIKEALNQPHKHIVEKNEAIKDIANLIKKAEYIRADDDIKGRKIKYHYLGITIQNEDSFVVLKEEKGVVSFYSITDKIKK